MSRNRFIDSVRGFALLGLSLTNLFFMANFSYGYIPPVDKDLLEQGLSFLATVMADGRFRTLFCLVFGAALMIQYKQHKQSAHCLFHIKTRLCVLAVFGILHGYLLWPGDILLNYALSGLLALMWLDSKHRLYAAGLLTVLPVGLLVVLSYLVREPAIDRASVEYALMMDSLPLNYNELLSQNMSNFTMMILLIPIATLWNTLGLMLLGMELYERGWFTQSIPSCGKWLWTAWWVSFSVSLLLWLIKESVMGLVLETVNWLAAIPMALCYLVLIQAISRSTPTLSGVLAIVGRYSLTLYLTQTVIGIGFFHFVFPDTRLSFTRIDYFLFFLNLTLGQVILAILLNRAEKPGPAEYILRRCVGYLGRT
ncbi:DUF418 domain-containing protein [Pseudoalteromonas sp. R3]|uniref:DUF418 domain-containing protein n=1 Tax=Pseudoalteromonas sp. R3 TaxID=1709477 RepID=UPI0006B471F9|nr:DUF418 domain-containing protein [Pseudoalteromonas sp. R3]AZZ95928.1 DUF418 domain-containing protein [Pseudoalteromonas sp. R3]